MRKRGQASIEFLTTYGWAILMMVIVLGVLSYSGFLRPSKLLPERCSFPPEIICEDFALTDPGSVDVRLRHNFGKTIVINNVTCLYRNDVTDTDSSHENADWFPKQSIEVSCSGAGLYEGSKDKVGVLISYKKSATGYDHSLEGEIYAEVAAS